MNKVILIGNPNTGKTTLYNTLTKASEHVGNWHGVTVDVREKEIDGLKNFILCDLPGLYSLDVYSPEEKISLDFLKENASSLIVNICDANNLKRNLYLTLQLKELGLNVCMAINMAKELKNSTAIFNHLSSELNIPIFGIDARKKKTCKELLEFIKNFYDNKSIFEVNTLNGLNQSSYTGNNLSAQNQSVFDENAFKTQDKTNLGGNSIKIQVKTTSGANSLNSRNQSISGANSLSEQNKTNFSKYALNGQNQINSRVNTLNAQNQTFGSGLAEGFGNGTKALTSGIQKGVAEFTSSTRQGIEKGVSSIMGGIEDGINNGLGSIIDGIGKAVDEFTNPLKKNAKLRYDTIEKVLNSANYTKNCDYGKSKLDKLFLNKYLFLFVFALFFAVIFIITFGSVGQSLSSALGDGFNACLIKIFPSLMVPSSSWFASFIKDGIVGGVLSILSFLPQIMLLFLFINLLEDVGYLSRVAFMLDGGLNRIGLTGRAVFSLLMGFGCTTSAVIATRNLDNVNLRKKTALLLPNFSCSAKLPIYACICSAFFAKTKILVVLGLYLLGVVVSLVVAFINAKLSKEDYMQSFIMEMPKLRFPSFPKIIKSVLGHAKDFLTRVGTVIFAMNLLVWAISSFDFKFQFVPNSGTEPILNSLSGIFAPIFKPLGFGSPAIVVALVTGLVAKEMVLSSLLLANGVTTIAELSSSLFVASSPASFTTASALSFLVFVLFYPACISAITATKKELGTKMALKSICLQFALAYALSFITYRIALSKNVLQVILVAVVVLVLAISLLVVIHYSKKSCKENCNACQGKLNKKNCGKKC